MIPFNRLGMGAFNNEDFQMMRYINVEDKNGKKIYQKDICKYYNGSDKDGIGILILRFDKYKSMRLIDNNESSII